MAWCRKATTITRNNVDLVLCRHVASIIHSDLTYCINSIQLWKYVKSIIFSNISSSPNRDAWMATQGAKALQWIWCLKSYATPLFYSTACQANRKENITIILQEHCCILVQISPIFVPMGPIYNKLVLAKIMARCWADDKPFSTPMMAYLADATDAYMSQSTGETAVASNPYRMPGAKPIPKPILR